MGLFIGSICEFPQVVSNAAAVSPMKLTVDSHLGKLRDAPVARF